jgi:predicted pyridoxine 5'-phosphate oxidase superfamily flavin-nucleotide-binding protein
MLSDARHCGATGVVFMLNGFAADSRSGLQTQQVHCVGTVDGEVGVPVLPYTAPLTVHYGLPANAVTLHSRWRESGVRMPSQ